MKIVYYQIDLILLIRQWKNPSKVRLMKKKCSLSGARTHKSLGSTEIWLVSIKFAPKIWIFKKIRFNLPSVLKISRLYRVYHIEMYLADMIKTRKFFESVNKVVEVAEASEANEVDEAAGVYKASKSLLRTSKLSRFLNSALFWSLEQIISW